MKHFSFDSRVSTTYVPLQPPYQIIKYGKEIGMQIGTLIATVPSLIEEDSSFQIETHSFPVVAYGNKEKAPKDKHLFEKDLTEGVVWNRVELRKLSTICLSNSHLAWQEFIDCLWNDLNRMSYTSEPSIYILSPLKELGVTIDPIPGGVHVMHLQTYVGDERPTMVRTDREDSLAFNVEYKNDVKSMAVAIEHQLSLYELMMVITFNEKRPKWKLLFTTDEVDLQPLVDLLNTPTKRPNVKTGYFTIRAIDEYEDDKAEGEWEEVK